MADTPRLMVLGAGVFQLAGIRRAADLGCEVITVDYLPHNIGHRFSHQSVDASTTDVDAVLDAAGRMNIDGIITFSSDVATRTVAIVADKLGLPGPNVRTVDTMSNKSRFRQFQIKRGFPSPPSTTVRNVADVAQLLQSWTDPAIVKPVDSSGSRGVHLVEDPLEWKAAVEDALTQSRAGHAIVERVVEGTEVGGDAFFLGGEMLSGVVTSKYLDGFLVSGHSLPSRVPRRDQKRVLRAVGDTCRDLGYVDGPVNFDVMIQQQEVVVLELSPRTGGNGIPELIEYATGFDEYAATIQQALGRPVERGMTSEQRGCGSAVFASRRGGRLVSLVDPEEAVRTHPDLVAVYSRYKTGETIPPYTNGGTAMGYVLFSCVSNADYRRKVENLPAILQMEVE